MFNIYKWLFWFLFTFIFGLYFLQHVVCAFFFKTQNLKKKYNAQWALVTGASSGIGKSIAFRLARQGLNVVVVALGDQLLDTTFTEIQEAFPRQQFRKVAANLGGDSYMPDIIKATEDIDVQIVFCNAGYILTGLFFARTINENMTNYNCNATSAMQITHHFLRKMIAAKQKGCIVYTSSAAALAPGPASVLYAATKSFLAAFGASLAAEARPYGIDVLVFFPSPVATRFYDKAKGLDALEFFRQFAVSPDQLPDTVFASIGRTAWRDVGPTAVGFRLMMKIVDYNFLAWVTGLFGSSMADFQRQKKLADAALKQQIGGGGGQGQTSRPSRQ